MKTKIKTMLTKALLWIVLMWWVSTYATTWDTLMTLELTWQPTVNIYAPDYLDFWTGTVSTINTYMNIDLKTYSWWWLYFAVEDLKWSSAWYRVSFSINDLENQTNSWTISKDNAYITLSWANSGITLLWWTVWATVPAQVVIPSWITDSVLWQPWWVVWIERTVATAPYGWILWKYWIQPKISIMIPKYQQVWSYAWQLTFTINEL